MKLKLLALIPARGGSKRLPKKNTLLLGGKPIINWSIEVAKNIADICDIMVSTDDEFIAKIAKDTGALVPWLRPDELSTDTASSIDVVLHALNWYEKEKGDVDGVIILQPTSPFRTRNTVLQGIELFKENAQQSVVGVSPTHAHPMWSMKIVKGNLVPFIAEHGLNLRSQDLPTAYIVNGGFYLIAPSQLRKLKSFWGEKTTPLIMHSMQEAIDIDTKWDFMLATTLVNNETCFDEVDN